MLLRGPCGVHRLRGGWRQNVRLDVHGIACRPGCLYRVRILSIAASRSASFPTFLFRAVSDFLPHPVTHLSQMNTAGPAIRRDTSARARPQKRHDGGSGSSRLTGHGAFLSRYCARRKPIAAASNTATSTNVSQTAICCTMNDIWCCRPACTIYACHCRYAHIGPSRSAPPLTALRGRVIRR